MPRRVWSTEEDEKLIALVEQLGDKRGRDSKWTEISKNLPGRTNKDCRKRWFHSLDPKLRKGRWTKEEDEILLAAHRRLGPAWKEIALLIKGRKDDQCAKRYTDILDPSVKNRLRSWSQEEDHYLTTKVKELGHRWATISSGLPGRPPLTCRNRWRRLCKEITTMPNQPSQGQDDSTELSPSSGSGSIYPGSSSGNASSMDNGLQEDGESPDVHLDAMDMATGLSENILLSSPFDLNDAAILSMRYQDEGYMSLQHDSDMFSHPLMQNQAPESNQARTHTGHLSSNENAEMNTIPRDFPSISSPEGRAGDRDRLVSNNTNISGQETSPTNDLHTFSADNIRLALDSFSQSAEPDQSAMEEAAVRQVLMSAQWTTSSSRDALSRSYPTQAREVHHHHHFHHHFHHHHYHHQSHGS
ncbi:hypothetical protein AKAW_09149 [Aspergillus niger]|uniref:Uncharacterized protein n=1 Tax=Aspergillus niger TaxID=5061 RepID=A0A100IBY0_ASPNG|nr:hypothetical protein AKAW_09149 [Aspergillus niger]